MEILLAVIVAGFVSMGVYVFLTMAMHVNELRALIEQISASTEQIKAVVDRMERRNA